LLNLPDIGSSLEPAVDHAGQGKLGSGHAALTFSCFQPMISMGSAQLAPSGALFAR
jgi:hypothetical protein